MEGIVYACGDGGGIDLLWTNPNSMSDFAPKTIELDLSEYNFIEIEFRFNRTSFKEITMISKFAVGNSTLLTCTQSTSELWLMGVYRKATSSDSGITFSECRYGNPNTSTVVSDSCIPTRIWGIK